MVCGRKKFWIQNFNGDIVLGNFQKRNIAQTLPRFRNESVNDIVQRTYWKARFFIRLFIFQEAKLRQCRAC